MLGTVIQKHKNVISEMVVNYQDISSEKFDGYVICGCDCLVQFVYGKFENVLANGTQVSAKPLLDACGGHFGVTPDSGGASVYHYHIQEYAPFSIGWINSRRLAPLSGNFCRFGCSNPG